MGAAELPDVVLDCRWLGIGGPGRITELVLRALATDPPDRWLLWGPAAVRSHAWPGADVRVTGRDPRQWRGQRQWFELPPARVTVFLHQQRPLRRVPSVTLIHDTIQLRYVPSRADLAARRLYLRRSAMVSGHVLTVSRYARSCIVRDLGVDEDRITVLPVPVDDVAADRLLATRRRTPTREFALCVGRFAPHKNLPRLVQAFERTRFCAGGGRLVLVGGSPDALPSQPFLDVHPSRSQAELEELLAAARLLVQPSLEEGFGLPVQEALAAGVPVCVSDGGALPEVARGLAQPFPATSMPAMAEAIDEGVDRSRRAGPEEAEAMAEEFRRQAPSLADLAASLRRAIDRQLAGTAC